MKTEPQILHRRARRAAAAIDIPDAGLRAG